MAHSLAEMDPAAAEEALQRINREGALRESLADVPLERFTASDVVHLVAIFDPFSEHIVPWEQEKKYMEIAVEWRKQKEQEQEHPASGDEKTSILDKALFY